MSPEETRAAAIRRSLGKAWPLYAAAAAVALSLLAVYGMLHPRGSGAAASEAETQPAIVTVEKAELRRQPSPGAAAVASVTEGAKIRVRIAAGRWVEAETDSGERGYLPADCLERDADRAERQKRARKLLALAPVFGVVGKDTDIVLAPYPLAARGGRLAQGSVIAIHSVDHSYFAFADKKWGIAFVASAEVDLVPPDPRKPAIAAEKVKPLEDLTVLDLEGEPPPEEEAEAEGAAPGATPAPSLAAGVPSEPAPGLIEPPVVLSRVEPAYTDLARRAAIEGTVELEVSIDASGKVVDVEVVRGLPLGLSEAAAQAVRRWTFRPARTTAGAVASRKTVRVQFVLRAGEQP